MEELLKPLSQNDSGGYVGRREMIIWSSLCLLVEVTLQGIVRTYNNFINDILFFFILGFYSITAVHDTVAGSSQSILIFSVRFILLELS